VKLLIATLEKNKVLKFKHKFENMVTNRSKHGDFSDPHCHSVQKLVDPQMLKKNKKELKLTIVPYRKPKNDQE
jgi:hypothetical protein